MSWRVRKRGDRGAASPWSGFLLGMRPLGHKSGEAINRAFGWGARWGIGGARRISAGALGRPTGPCRGRFLSAAWGQ